tara:strand:+ start:80 stop:1951 length:1872 start_codon:yes stop_codon:yes gene_type:complete
MMRRRISGQNFLPSMFNSASNNMALRQKGLLTKSEAQAVAKIHREMRAVQAPNGYNARVIPSGEGYRVWVGEAKATSMDPMRKSIYDAKRAQRIRAMRMRYYNKTTIPWRSFTDPIFGIDTPRLVEWLQMQPEYNENLSWQENLRIIGGEGSIDTLMQIQNPEATTQQKIQANEARRALVEGFDAQLIERGFMGYEGGAGLEIEELDPSSDIFEILNIAEEEPEAEIMDAWALAFEAGLTDYGESNFEKLDAAEKTEEMLQETVNETRNLAPTPIEREYADEFQKLFVDAFWGDEDTITRPDGTVVMKPLLESEISPTLGFSQPTASEGLRNTSAGYWTFQPNQRGSWNEDDFDTRRAWLVSDSLGTVVNAYPYPEGDDPRSKADSFEAIRQAYLFAKATSEAEPYTEAGFQKHNNLSPGLVVIDGFITINEFGQWLGWDLANTSEDGRLAEGDYTLFLEGDVVDQTSPEITSEVTKNWILPRRNPRTGSSRPEDPLRQKLEFIIGQEGIEGAEAQAKLARAKYAQSQGASTQGVLDALQNNRYIIRRPEGSPVTKWMPDFGTALQTLQALSANDVGSSELIMNQAPSKADGSIDESKTRVHGELQFVGGKWLIDYTPGGGVL